MSRSEPHADDVERLGRALAGDREEMRALVRRLEPIIRMRVGRALIKRSGDARGRDLKSEADDFVQEAFVALFARNGKALRAWEPERGLSLERFVGFLAEREVHAVLRTGRRSPWTEDPTLDERLDRLSATVTDPRKRIESRDLLARVASRMKERLSPLGLHYFYRLLVEQRPVATLARESGATEAALYNWRSRLNRVLQEVRTEIAREEDSDG